MPANNMLAFIPQKWSKRVLTKLDRINVMLPLVNRDYEGDIKAEGDTVWVRTYGNVQTGTYTRGMPIVYQPMAPTKEALTINDSKYFAFELDDLDDAQMDLKALDGYTDRAAVAMSELIEDKLQAQFGLANALNILDAGGSGSANNGTPITLSTANAYTTLVDCGKLLTLRNVPRNGRWAIITPDWEAFLQKDTTYLIRATDMGDTMLQTGRPGSTASNAPGFIGRLANFDLYVSNATPVDSGGRRCMFGQGKPISYAGQIRKIEKIRRESTFADTVRGLILHDATVFAEQAKALGNVLVNV